MSDERDDGRGVLPAEPGTHRPGKYNSGSRDGGGPHRYSETRRMTNIYDAEKVKTTVVILQQKTRRLLQLK